MITIVMPREEAQATLAAVAAAIGDRKLVWIDAKNPATERAQFLDTLKAAGRIKQALEQAGEDE